jgi:hypothetical protein
LDVKRAANYAELLEEDASFAIDYAIASIEQAKMAVLDAIAGHLEVEKAKRTGARSEYSLDFGETAAGGLSILYSFCVPGMALMLEVAVLCGRSIVF